MTDDKPDLDRRLQDMDDQLAAMIAFADERQDHLLGALLCDVQVHVAQQRATLADG